MELHVSNRNSRKLGIVGVVYGLFAGVVGAIFLAIGGRAAIVTVIAWVSGGFFLLLGLIVLAGSMRKVRIAFSESGLIVNTPNVDFEGPWSQVEGISIEMTPRISENNPGHEVLALWLAEGVPTKRPASWPVDSPRKGFVLTELSDLEESREEVVAILERYAGDRHKSLR